MRSSFVGTLVVLSCPVLLGMGCGRSLSPVADPSGVPALTTAGGTTIECRDKSGQKWILDAVAVGPVVTLGPDGQPVVNPRAVFRLTQVYVAGVAPHDTVPAQSVAYLRWRPAGSQLGDPTRLDVAASGAGPAVGRGAPADTQTLMPGLNLITVDVPKQAGGGTRTLVCWGNFVPDTWWAGPDPARWPVSTDGENARAVDVTDWSTFTTSPAWPPDGRAYFGPDSFRFLPSTRRPLGGGRRGTFYEIYANRIYARAEGDTVHRNSIVVLVNGGYDKDSEYVPRVDPADPALPPGFAGDPVRYAVLHTSGLVGSPIGFRPVIGARLTPHGIKMMAPLSDLYPVYEPASVFRAPYLARYWLPLPAGKAYALARAQDADGGLDVGIANPITLADAVDGGGGSPAEQAARRKVIVFYVDKAPALVRDGSFRPYDGQAIGTEQWEFRLQGMDLDPFVPWGGPPGGPTATSNIRFKIALYGKSVTTGADTSWTYVAPTGLPYVVANPLTLSFIPGGTMAKNPFASGDIRVSIEICDCVDCESVPGQGRCVPGIDPATGQVVNPRNVITVHYTRPAGS
jgi:hypothetical protein